MSKNIEKETLNKILLELNITNKQLIEEGLFDKIKTGINTAANKVAAATTNPAFTINLKDTTVQAIEQLKTLTLQLEKQLSNKTNVSEKEATTIYQQMNGIITNSIKAAQTELAKQKQQGGQPLQQQQPVATSTQAQANIKPTATIPANPNLGIQQPNTPPVVNPPILPPGATTFTYGQQQPINKTIQ